MKDNNRTKSLGLCVIGVTLAMIVCDGSMVDGPGVGWLMEVAGE